MDQSKLSLGEIVEAYIMIVSGFSLAYVFDGFVFVLIDNWDCVLIYFLLKKLYVYIYRLIYIYAYTKINSLN